MQINNNHSTLLKSCIKISSEKKSYNLYKDYHVKQNHKNLKQKVTFIVKVSCFGDIPFKSKFTIPIGDFYYVLEMLGDFYSAPVSGSAHMAEDGERIGARFSSLDRSQPLWTERRLY